MKSNKEKIVILIALAFLCVIVATFLNTDNQITQNYSNDDNFFEFEESINDLRFSGIYTNLTINDFPGSPNNWAWAKTQPWCSGSGTELNPYIIEGHNLKMFNPKNGIQIVNSISSYFIIRNCNITWDTTQTNTIFMTGIFLSNTTKGQIINNTIYHLGKGIHLNQSQTVQIVNNTIYDHPQEGIFIENCDFVEIFENNVYDNNDNGIEITNGDRNTITRNIANGNGNAGIYLASSDYNNITENSCRGSYDGLFLEDDCDNNTISKNIFHSNNIGIELYYSDSNTIVENDANDNAFYGISLEGSENNTISGNQANNNTQIGIRLTQSTNNNTISGNIRKIVWKRQSILLFCT